MRSIRAAVVGAALVLTVSSCGTGGDSTSADAGCPSGASDPQKSSTGWDRPADFDNDGYPDAVAVVRGDPATAKGAPPVVLSRSLAVFMGGKDGLRPTGQPLADGVVPPGSGSRWKEGFAYTYTADLDADGYTDVLAEQRIPKNEHADHPGSMVLFRGGRSGLSAKPVAVPFPEGDKHTESPPTAVGDFNGDDRADVLAPIPGKEPGVIGQILYGPFGSDGRPASTRSVTVQGRKLGHYSSLRAADIDADGRTDLLFTVETDDFADEGTGGNHHPLRWLRGTAKDGMAEAESPPGKYDAGLDTGTDYDADGYPDTLTGPSRQGAGRPMLRGGPDGFRPGIHSLRSDSKGGAMVTGDITGDGRAEAVSTVGTGKYATTKQIWVSELKATKDGARMHSVQRISHNDKNLPGAAAGNRFGESLQLLDGDRDGCADLLTGAEFTGSSYQRGGFWVFRGGADGLRTDGIRHYGLRELGLLTK
ncbi:hypothetical protein U9R90_01145 [Streptomyces sp. E11-3]|uniref:hypothetical protein n=1 Tax=Streptomyces sp. E11-3 TaxID=3110112 RepID=UPI0039803DF7